MSFEAHYTKRPARVLAQDTTARVAPAAGSRRLRMRGEPDADSDRILDLSTKGLKLVTTGEAPELESLLEVELRHRHLRGPLRVLGRVKWTDAESGRTYVGVSFEQLRDTTRVALMQLVVLELGSSVRGSKGAIGFVSGADAPAGSLPARYTVYDLKREVIATIQRTPAGLLIEREGERELPTLREALERVFGEPQPKIVPPLA